MTPKQFKADLLEIRKDIGPDADVWTSINAETHSENVIRCSVYPTGMTHGASFVVNGETFEELLTALRAKWAAHKDEYIRQLVRKMALKVIEITALVGECTDAALRGGGFNTQDVARYGEQACAEANDIAGRGPFTLRKLGASNGAPDEVAAS